MIRMLGGAKDLLAHVVDENRRRWGLGRKYRGWRRAYGGVGFGLEDGDMLAMEVRSAGNRFERVDVKGGLDLRRELHCWDQKLVDIEVLTGSAQRFMLGGGRALRHRPHATCHIAYPTIVKTIILYLWATFTCLKTHKVR